MHIADYTLFLFGMGGIILLVAWLPLALRKLPLSLPIVCVAIGFGVERAGVLPLEVGALYGSKQVERLTEAVVLIALMGAGLRLDRPFGWKRWESTWRLLLVAMPLTIGALLLLGVYGLGWSWSASLLLAAALSPTDPVLASDVQTGPPGKGEPGEVRFALTSEAGLNDGLAFPFVTLALVGLGASPMSLGHWVAVEFAGELAIGAAVGFAGGRGMGWVMFHLPRLRLSDTGDGLVAVGVTLMTYATALALHGNGFVAVFVAAAAIRRAAPLDDFHHAMSEFSEQVERVLLMLVLVLFGWGLGAGLLAALTWREAALALALIFVVRPASAWLGFTGSTLQWQPRALMAFFGIRGIGTLFYLQYAFNRASVPEGRALVATAGFAVAVSILLHGTTSTPLMRLADAFLKRQGRARERARALPGAEREKGEAA